MESDIGKMLLSCAQSAIKGRASSFGTLMATGAMAMAKVGMGKQEISRNELAGMLAAAVEKMAARGKSSLGSKTVLDAIDAVRAAIAASDDCEDPASVADRAADEALERFRGLSCKQGRARIFAEKSRKLDDPGMVVIKKMTEALNTLLGSKRMREETNEVPCNS
jgi:dihydroxyacetone kinase-like protein